MRGRASRRPSPEHAGATFHASSRTPDEADPRPLGPSALIDDTPPSDRRASVVRRVVGLAAVLVAFGLACGRRPAANGLPTAPASGADVDLVPATRAGDGDEGASGKPLRIASWNVRRLGHGSTSLDRVADVIDEFDLVVVQEVMTPEVIGRLLSRLPGYEALLTDSPRPLEGRYREYFAAFYRADRFDPVLNTHVPDPSDRFVRDPWLACFVVRDHARRLCMLTVHVVWGDSVAARKAEILALDEAVRWAQTGDETSDWLVLGDFNRPVDGPDSDDAPDPEWHRLLDTRHLRAPVVLAGPDLPTTLGPNGWANAYDHVFVSESLAKTVVTADRFDFVAAVCGGDFALCHDETSDHAPVFVELAW